VSTVAVVPVKALSKSKTRLSTLFTFQERRVLALSMLQDVLVALKSSKVNKTIVVSSDIAVQKRAKDFGVTFLKEAQEGLNQALGQAMKWCIRKNAESVLVLPADIPLITSQDINQIMNLSLNCSLVISPSLNGGTNALLQKPPGILSYCFGPDSFRKHVCQALSKNIQTKFYLSSSVLLDIDSEKDLVPLQRLGQPTLTHQFLRQNALHKRANLSVH